MTVNGRNPYSGANKDDGSASNSSQFGPNQASLVQQLIDERHLRWMEPTRLADDRRSTLLNAGVDIIEHLGTAPLPTKFGDWTYVAFGDRTTGSHASALVYGDLADGAFPAEGAVPVRVHSACSATELFLAEGCGGTDKIESWMKTVHEQNGPGVIVYLDHDGRGNGMQMFLEELKSKFFWSDQNTLDPWKDSGIPKDQQPETLTIEDSRNFHAARRIIHHLGILNPLIVSDNDLKRAQLNDDFSEDTPRCPDNEVMYFELQARKLVEAANEEWKKPWSAIAHCKNLLQTSNHPIVRNLGSGPLKTSFGDWTMIAYGDYTSGEVHIALVYGEFRDALDGDKVYPLRVHSSCQTNEKFHALNCECRAELHETMERIRQEGRGVILYLQQEGRGNGVYGKMFQLQAMFGWRDGRIVQNVDADGNPVTTVKGYEQHGFHGEIRDFSVAGAILHDLGVKKVQHHSNNPRKKRGLEESGIEVVDVRNLHFPEMISSNPILLHDLRDKMTGLGHDFRGLFGDNIDNG